MERFGYEPRPFFIFHEMCLPVLIPLFCMCYLNLLPVFKNAPVLLPVFTNCLYLTCTCYVHLPVLFGNVTVLLVFSPGFTNI